MYCKVYGWNFFGTCSPIAKNGRSHRSRIWSAAGRGTRSKLEKSRGTPGQFAVIGIRAGSSSGVEWLPAGVLTMVASRVPVNADVKDAGVAIVSIGGALCPEATGHEGSSIGIAYLH
jgi:hypothetical protein